MNNLTVQQMTTLRPWRLRELKKKMSMKEIAKRYNLDYGLVTRRCQEYKIK